MPNEAPATKFLGSTPARVLTIVLLTQCAVFYGFSRSENLPVVPPLKDFPVSLNQWRMVEEGTIEQEVLDVLKADDLLSRVYARPGTENPVNLFVAFFRSQRTGKAPHSPRNCLPGSGWHESSADEISVDISGRPPIRVNRYVTQKGETKAVVLYWYQSRDRVVPGEFAAKFWVVADAIRYNRTDTALVRVWVPFIGSDAEAATRIAVEFVQSMFTPMRQHMPA